MRLRGKDETAPAAADIPVGDEPVEVKVEFDKAEQLEKTKAALLANEVLEAVFDLSGIGSGFIGITNRRLMLQDRRALTSYPYHQVSAVSAAGGWLASSKLVLTMTNTQVELEFRDKARAMLAHNLILRHVLA
jgi:hypothetical protein